MYKILVIDDEEILRERLKKLLVLDDFDVVVAEDGKRAIEVFKVERPQVAICDIKMPGMDGVEVLKHLKQLTDDIEIIMVTGHASIETALEALRLGAFDYIGKPVNYDELKLVVDRAIETRELKIKVRQQETHREFFEKQMLLQLRANLNMTKTLVGEQISKLPAGHDTAVLRGITERIEAMFQLHGLLDPNKEEKEIAMLQAICLQIRQVFGLASQDLEVAADDVALATDMATTCGWIVRGILTYGFVGDASVPHTLPASVSFTKKGEGGHELKVSIHYQPTDLGSTTSSVGTTEIEQHIIPMVTSSLEGVVKASLGNDRCDFVITFPCHALNAF